MKFSQQLTAYIAAIFCVCGPAQAQTGRATIDRLVGIFSQWSGSSQESKVYREAAGYIDFEGMAERSLSGEWKKLSPAQRAEFTDTLRTLIEERYYLRWHKIFKKAKLAYVNESSAGGDTKVATLITLGKKKDQVEWQLDSKDGQPKLINLAVNDSDLLNRLSGRLQNKLNKAGFAAMIAWMKNKSNSSSEAEKSNVSKRSAGLNNSVK